MKTPKIICLASGLSLAFVMLFFFKNAHYLLTPEEIYKCYFPNPIPESFGRVVRSYNYEDSEWVRYFLRYEVADSKWTPDRNGGFARSRILPWGTYSRCVAFRNLLIAPIKTIRDKESVQTLEPRLVPKDLVELFCENGWYIYDEFAERETMRYVIHHNVSGHGSSDVETLLFWVGTDFVGRRFFEMDILPYDLDVRLQALREERESRLNRK